MSRCILIISPLHYWLSTHVFVAESPKIQPRPNFDDGQNPPNPPMIPCTPQWSPTFSVWKPSVSCRNDPEIMLQNAACEILRQVAWWPALRRPQLVLWPWTSGCWPSMPVLRRLKKWWVDHEMCMDSIGSHIFSLKKWDLACQELGFNQSKLRFDHENIVFEPADVHFPSLNESRSLKISCNLGSTPTFEPWQCFVWF